MGNCLKSQLKETVQNENLKEFEVLPIHVNTSSGTTIMQIKCVNEAVFSGKNEAMFGISSASFVYNSYNLLPNTTYYIYLPSTGGDYKLKRKYDIITISISSWDSPISYEVDILEYSSALESVQIGTKCFGDFRTLKNLSNLKVIAICNTVLSNFNLEDVIPYLTSLEDFQVVNSGQRPKGNLSAFNNCKKIRTINFFGSYALIGEITSLCDALYNNGTGKTEGTLTITGNGVITLNSNTVANNTKKWAKFGTNLPSGAEYTGTGYAVYATNPDA